MAVEELVGVDLGSKQHMPGSYSHYQTCTPPFLYLNYVNKIACVDPRKPMALRQPSKRKEYCTSSLWRLSRTTKSCHSYPGCSSQPITLAEFQLSSCFSENLVHFAPLFVFQSREQKERMLIHHQFNIQSIKGTWINRLKWICWWMKCFLLSKKFIFSTLKMSIFLVTRYRWDIP